MRPKEFSVDDALDKAMEVFWAKGFEAASLHDLTAAMALSRSSFYETFGCKRELFLSAIDRYIATVSQGLIASLENGLPPRQAIEAIFNGCVEKAMDGGLKGCLLGNCAVEMSAHDAEAARRVAVGMRKIEDGWYRAVKRGQESGAITSTRDARALARYLASSINGLLVMARANPEREMLEDVVAVVLSGLD